MKRHSLCYFVALPAMLLALSALAHDPKEHMKEAQAPDCAAMKDMDHSKMDMKDAVMQAMMQKCMKAMHKDEEGSHEANGDKGHHDHGKQNEMADEKNSAKHQHKQ